MEVIPSSQDLSRLTTEELAELLSGDRRVVVMLPVGVLEPHGPHLGLGTDEVISLGAAIRAAAKLESSGLAALIAPPVSYGVTDCASAFKGAVTVSAAALSAYLSDIVRSFLDDGVAHVCLINNHLEPAHIDAVSQAADGFGSRASIACPVTKRWARTLSDEFKSGACHAGEYETAIMMDFAPHYVRDEVRQKLPEVPVSLSRELRKGVTDFEEMGLRQAYAGAPARATARHGRDQLERLATMVATIILETLPPGSSPTKP